MTAGMGQPGTGWQITDQQEEIQVGDNNRIQEGYRIFFRTQYNVLASVWLSRLNYTPDKIKAAVNELASNLDATHTLTG